MKTKIISYLIFYFLLNLTFVSAQEISPAKKKLAKGIDFYQKGNYQEALNEFSQSIPDLKKKEDLYQAYFFSGLSSMLSGNSEQARKNFRKAIAYFPERQLDKEIYSPKIIDLYQRLKKQRVRRPRVETSMPPRVKETGKIKIAVMDLKPEGVLLSVAMNLTELLREFIFKLGEYDILTKEELKNRAEELIRCDTEACLADIANALGVEQILTGKVGRVGDTYVITLRRVDSLLAQTINMETRECPKCSEGKLLKLVKNVAYTLFFPSTIEISSNEKGAKVFVDKKSVGELAEVKGKNFFRKDIGEGRHTIMLKKPGFHEEVREIEIAEGKTLSLKINLKKTARTIYEEVLRSKKKKVWRGMIIALLAGGGTYFTRTEADKAYKKRDEARLNYLNARSQTEMNSYYNKFQKLDKQGELNQGLFVGLSILSGLSILYSAYNFFTLPDKPQEIKKSASNPLASSFPLIGEGQGGGEKRLREEGIKLRQRISLNVFPLPESSGITPGLTLKIRY